MYTVFVMHIVTIFALNKVLIMNIELNWRETYNPTTEKMPIFPVTNSTLN